MPAASGTSAVPEADVVPLAKAEVLRMSESSLPQFEFARPSLMPSALEHAAERSAAHNAADSDLPKYDFKAVKSLFPAQVMLSIESTKPAAAPATTGFNWAAAGMKAPSKSGWQCGTCCIQNEDTR
jgi:hypothetical protein